ncbi:pyrroloquinoline quinone biosynthesis protein PqqB [Chthonomonas calidirosea]|uniref:pyrroloquinoline quinone biosynthesis protein PqqB n=1 Tax=Chthonomonas calidirosea TaxID=454171 RepID=UPI0006ECBBA7|nr:pyrroloquinoline quinone biosynthesis protein PqqB [Chthonomonas calidirosea]CEK14344.1 metal-dependent hydrolase, beta-lactamase superfamily I [Chthonomonas calidirosea]
MYVRLLGTAAGGGFPQWNCACLCCSKARSDPNTVKPRTQSSVAVSADGQNWFILNASPDITLQIEAFPRLHPHPARHTPIQAVLITNADLDHALGLFLLREHSPLVLYTTPTTRQTLIEGLGIERILSPYTQLIWRLLPHIPQPLLLADESPSGLLVQAIDLPGNPPRYRLQSRDASTEHIVALSLTDAKTGKRLLYLPDLPCWPDSLTAECARCDLLLIDGTFWEEQEMIALGFSNRTATQIGHLPISGHNGSLSHLMAIRTCCKVYVHINNTNPILIPDSYQRRIVETAGCLVGEDGMEFVL